MVKTRDCPDKIGMVGWLDIHNNISIHSFAQSQWAVIPYILGTHNYTCTVPTLVALSIVIFSTNLEPVYPTAHLHHSFWQPRQTLLRTSWHMQPVHPW